MISKILIASSIVPLVFLVYTLTHLKKLQITISHPRVIVELAVVLILLVTGIIIIPG